MVDRIWKEVDSADIPKLEEIMNSVEPGSPKWLRAKARVEKLRHERGPVDDDVLGLQRRWLLVFAAQPSTIALRISHLTPLSFTKYLSHSWL